MCENPVAGRLFTESNAESWSQNNGQTQEFTNGPDEGQRQRIIDC